MTAKTATGVTKATPGRNQNPRGHGSGSGCRHPRLNQLWSIWYCTMTLAFQIYIVVNSVKRFMRYIALPWPSKDQPYLELNAYVGFVGAAVVLLPFFVVSAVLRVGNYSNDGCKIGRDPEEGSGGSSCSKDSAGGPQQTTTVKGSSTVVTGDPAAVYQNLSKGSNCSRWFKNIWKHGGPTAPILHMAAAFCLLVPTVLMQAQLIRHGFLSKADIWKTDLDFFLTHKDRLVVLGFLSTVNQSEALNREETDRLVKVRVAAEVTSGSPVEGVIHEPLELSPVSAEFVNYCVALLVHAVRYPSVFWRANKAFGLLFSVQLVADAAQKILAFAGFTVLYKIHMYGVHDVLLRHNPLLLNVPVTLILFLLYNLVLTLSGSVLYLYGLQKYREWREASVRKTHVTWKEENKRLWGHVPHVTAFLVLLMVAITAAPLMYDYTMVYCGSLDGAMLAGVTGTVTHLFCWIVLWLVLTIKHRWHFNRQALCDGRAHGNLRGSAFKNFKEAPLLVIENGQTYQVREKSSKKAIIHLAQRSSTPTQGNQGNAATKQMSPASADDEDIYWLKPKAPLPKDSKDSPDSDRLAWLKTHKKSPGLRHKVSFDEKGAASSGSPCKRTRSSASTKSPKVSGKNKKGVKFEDLSDSNSDDGDYATLREMVAARDDTTDDEQIDQPLFHQGNPNTRHQQHRRILSADGDYELLVDDNCLQALTSASENQLNAPVIVHGVPLRPMHRTGQEQILLGDGYEPLVVSHSRNSDGHLTPKSDTVSDNSISPEKGGGGCGSESSSGVHSNSSVQGDPKRASSMENLLQDLVQAASRPTPWKSMSLQRNTPPPPLHSSEKLYRLAPGTNTAPRPVKPDAIYFDPQDSAVIIRRKAKQANGAVLDQLGQSPASNILPITEGSEFFGRATNMRMTSFTDQPDFPNGGVLQNQGHYQSQMGPGHVLPGPNTSPPLPGPGSSPKKLTSLPSSPKTVGSNYLLSNDGSQNPMSIYGTTATAVAAAALTSQVKQFTGLLGNGIYGSTKPMGLIGPTTLLPMYPVHQRRDSANYSLTSSGDSDTYTSHT